MKLKTPHFDNLHEACESCQVLYHSDIIPLPGEVRRLPTVAHPNKTNGVLIGLDKGAVYVMNWEDDNAHAVYTPFGTCRSLTSKQKMEINLAHWQSLKQQQKRKELGSQRAIEFLSAYCEPYKESYYHYLVEKKIRLYGNAYITNRQDYRTYFGSYFGKPEDDNRLLVFPLSDGERITSLQFISPSGEKRFMKGGVVKGAYWKGLDTIKPDGSKPLILIGEGVATVMSVAHYEIKQNADSNVLAVSALNCGNLASVAVTMRRKYKNVPILILADNDANGTGEAGAKKAQNMIVNCKVVKPVFNKAEKGSFLTKYGKLPTDWNDYYLIHNLI